MPEHHERSEGRAPILHRSGRLDIDLIHDFLSRESYWVPGIRREFVEPAIARFDLLRRVRRTIASSRSRA